MYRYKIKELIHWKLNSARKPLIILEARQVGKTWLIQEFLLNEDNDIYYWTNDNSTAEVDFVIQNEEEIIPIEVKSGTNIKSVSFKYFCEKYKPAKAIRTSLADYKQETWMTNLPLYVINSI